MDDLNKTYLKKSEVFSFAASGFGQNMIIGVVNSFMLYFYTDIFLIPSAAVITLMFVARIWDALLTPVVGNIVDKTRTRWGKLKPYLVASILPLAVITILLFFSPNLSKTFKLVYAYITYLSFGVIYTLSDVPFWGLASVMTPNPKERTNFISLSRTFHFIGNGLPVALVPIFVWIANDNLKKGYFLTGLFIGIVGAALFSLSVFGTKERCVFEEKKPTIRDNIEYFKINKPLKTVFIANILGFGQGLSVLASMYIATYLFNNGNLNVAVVAATGVSGYFGMMATPALLKKFNYKELYRLSAIVGVLAFVILFFVGYKYWYLFVACLFISGFPLGIIGNINFAMIADSIDYVEWKTGKRTEGVSISIQSLMIKLISALQVTFVSVIIWFIALKQPVEINGIIEIQEQLPETLDKLFYFIVFTPIIGWILGALIMSKYNFVGEMRRIAHEDLIEIRKNKTKIEI